MLDLVPRDGGHGGDPVLWRAGLGPAIEQFQRIRRRLFFQVRVIVQQLEWLRENCRGPGGGGLVKQWQVRVAHWRATYRVESGFLQEQPGEAASGGAMSIMAGYVWTLHTRPIARC